MSFAVAVNPSTGFGVALPGAPVFTVQPSGQSAAVGATATFTATATGAVSFQWQRLAP